MDAPFPDGMLEDIATFLATDREQPAGANLYPGVFATEHFFPLQRQRELARMMAIARTISPRVVYEIGADKGGGLYHWCKCLPSVERVVACEIRGTPYRHLFEEAFPHLDFLWIEGSSYTRENLARLDGWLGEDKLDALFIDGDKSAFLTDFDLCLPRMNPNGIVFMHDIQDAVPGDQFTAVVARAQYHIERIIDISESMEATAREANGVPSTGSHEGWLRHWRGRSAGVGVIYLGRDHAGNPSIG